MRAPSRRFSIVLLLPALALVGTLAVSGCGGADARRASHMQRGQEYLKAGNLEKARVEFRNALQIAPNDAEARFLSGRAAEQLGNIREAVGMYQGAIDIDADHVGAHANLGRVFVFAGVPQRALDLIAPTIAKHPDDPDLLTVRGAARSQLKDLPGARTDAEHAVKVAPNNENAVALLAALYRQAGDNPRAIDLLQTSLKTLPNSVELHQVLAALYQSAGDKPAAEDELRKVVQMQPKKLVMHYQLAMFYLQSKRVDDAERVLKHAIDVADDKDSAKLAYVQFLSSQRTREAGERALQEYIAREPDDYDLQLGLADLQRSGGEADKAIATYRGVINKDREGPKALTARNRIATIYVEQKKLDAASQLLEEVLKKNPRDNDALMLRGNIELDRGNAGAAIADLRAVLRDQPTAVGVLRTLARAHLSQGEPGLAEESLRAAMDAAPADTHVRIEMAQLLAQTQRAEQAVTLLEETVRANPTDPAAREALVRVDVQAMKLDAARTAAEDLKALRPDLAAGFYLAGVIAQGQNRLDDAQQNLEEAVRLQPRAMDALAALTRLENQRGHYDAALTRAKAVAENDAKNGVARNLLAEIYISGKHYIEAAAELQQTITLLPKWGLPYRNLALTQIAAKDVPGAIATYEKGVAATEYTDPMLVADLAMLYEQQGAADRAIQQYNSLHKRNPRLDFAANNLAMLLVTYRKDAASLDQARDLTAPFAKSENSALLDTHGWVQLKRGEVADALSVLEKAAAQSPDSRVIRYHLGMAQLKAGQRDRARSSLESALGGGGGFQGIDEARATLAQLKGPA